VVSHRLIVSQMEIDLLRPVESQEEVQRGCSVELEDGQAKDVPGYDPAGFQRGLRGGGHLRGLQLGHHRALGLLHLLLRQYLPVPQIGQVQKTLFA